MLKIPWKNLYGAPVEAAIERLYLLVVPNQEVKYDPAKEDKLAQEAKQTELLRIETAKKKAAEQGSSTSLLQLKTKLYLIPYFSVRQNQSG